jgi:7-keto-8-aminopelargonate synthetase-like enzyme/3-oxoacyl-(acyl-carrier-protein) synthase
MNRVLTNGEANGKDVASGHAALANPSAPPGATDAAMTELVRTIEDHVVRLLAEETKLPPSGIDVLAPFHRYGLNSVVIVEVTARLEGITGPLPKTLFFEHGSVRAIATALARAYGPAFAGRTKEAPARPPPPSPGLFQRARIERGRQASRADEPIAIIGLGGRYPEADDLHEFWTILAEGRDCIRVVPRQRWDAEAMFDPVRHRAGKIYAKWGGFLRDIAGFDHRFFGIARSEADFLDPQERLWLETAWHTLEDAGYTPESVRGRSVGMFVGVMSNMYQKLCAQVNGVSLSPFASYGSIANRTSYQLDLSGPSLSLDTMCSSSLTAIHLACESILRGESELALAGGVNVIVHPDKYVTQCLGGWFASDGRCRSFGADGDGYVPGEGVGAILLKRLSDAERDGDRVCGLIRATAVNHCGRTNSYFVPSPNAQAAVMQRAWERSGIDPRRISYFEAHGTGTSLGDPIEIRGIAKAFASFTADRQFCALGSVKSNVGHLESAAGIAALTKVLLQLKNKALVPSLHCDPPNPHISFEETPVYVQRRLETWPEPKEGEPRLAAISSFGAGGSNAHLVVEEYIPTTSRQNVGDEGPELVLLSAADDEALRRYVESWINYLEMEIREPDGARLADIAYTTQIGRVPMAARAAVIAHSKVELLEALRSHVDGGDTGGRVTVGTATPNPAVSALFEGPEGAEILGVVIQHQSWQKLAKLWALGARIEFGAVQKGRGLRRVSVPGYPFLRTPCWLSAEETAAAPVSPPSVSASAVEHGTMDGKAGRSILAKLERDVLETLAHVSPLPREQFLPSRRLFDDLGFDSLMLAGFHSRMTQRYPQLTFDVSAYSANMTVNDLVRILHDRLAGAGRVTGPANDTAAPAPGEPKLQEPVSVEPERGTEAHLRFDRFVEAVAARGRRMQLVAHGLDAPAPLAGPNGTTLDQNGSRLINFTTYDFLSLANDPRVLAAATQAVQKYGCSASASRPVGGEIPLYRQFEEHIARFIGTEKAVLFVSGHATNVTTLEILFGAGDLVLFDEGSALSSIVEGGMVSGAEVMAFPHGNLQELDRILDEVRKRYRKVLIAVEAVCATDGSIAELPRLLELKKKHSTFLLVDEDNSFGVLGATGRGLCEHHAVDPRAVDVISCGLHKSLASSGGFIAGDGPLVHLVKCTATSLIFAASIAPMSVAAARAALEILENEPQRSEAVRANARKLRSSLRAGGLHLGGEHGPLVTFRARDDAHCLRAAGILRQQGFLVEQHLRSEAAGTPAFVRVVVTADHTDGQLGMLANALVQVQDSWTGAEAGAAPPRSGSERVVRHTCDLAAKSAVIDDVVLDRYCRVGAFPQYQDLVARQSAVPPEVQMYWQPHEGIVNDRMVVGGKSTINFSSFNYLSLSGHREVIAAVERAVARHGTSLSSSRIHSGTAEIHVALEQEIASLLGVEAAVVFDAGHNTNVSSIGNLFGPGDLILHDALAHNSMIQGALLSGASRQPFPHNDYARMDQILAQVRGKYRRVCILIEGVYSQDGDIPALDQFIVVKRRHQALLFVDEAHSIGVIGQTGRGVCEHAGVDPAEVDILMGTLSKALATSGGYVAGSAALVEYLRQIPCYVHGANVSPAVAAAALEAIRVLRREPERVATAQARARLFLDLARREGLDTGISKDTAVIPIMTYSSKIAYELSHALYQNGVTAHPFTYPVVPENKARLRIFMNADHSEEQVARGVKLLGRLYRELKSAEQCLPRSFPVSAATAG